MSLAGASTIETSVKATARCVTVAIAICAWIAISNHCAFGAVAAKTEIAQSACPFHSKPAKEKGNSATLQPCCKILRAVLAKAAKSWMRDDTNFSIVDFSVALPIALADSHNVAPLLLDTGPPRVLTFAESVLQRSLLAHAPPLL